jgi:hypothetical protein
MKRHQLEHIIRAAGAITNLRDIVVIGSQALLGQFPEAPSDLLVSVEADVFPKDRPDLSIQIDGAIGELSPFHQTFGYYAHGVDETTATLPAGWMERLVPILNDNTAGTTGWCLEVHDLAAAKLVAGRPKDLDFIRLLLRERMVEAATLRQRCGQLPLPGERRAEMAARLARLA